MGQKSRGVDDLHVHFEQGQLVIMACLKLCQRDKEKFMKGFCGDCHRVGTLKALISELIHSEHWMPSDAYYSFDDSFTALIEVIKELDDVTGGHIRHSQIEARRTIHSTLENDKFFKE